jgi:hypothetical protein
MFNNDTNPFFDYHLDNVFYEMKPQINGIFIESKYKNLASLNQPITENEIFYTKEAIPSNFKINIIDLIDKLLDNSSFQNDILKETYLKSTQDENFSPAWKLIASISINFCKKSFYLLYVPYNGGMFIINNENNNLYILNNTLYKKSISLSKDSHMIITSGKYIVQMFTSNNTSLNTSYIHKSIDCIQNISNLSDNKTITHFHLTKSDNFPILKLNSKNIKSLSQTSNSLIASKYQVKKK